MLAEFYRADAPERVLGAAVWDGSGVRVEAEDEGVRTSLARIFRAVPVVVEDPSLRSYGTSGPVVFQPGGLLWFRAAAEGRAVSEGLRVRLVPRSQTAMGWDPAGAYRTFNNQIERRELAGPGPALEPGRAQ